MLAALLSYLPATDRPIHFPLQVNILSLLAQDTKQVLRLLCSFVPDQRFSFPDDPFGFRSVTFYFADRN